MPRGPKPLPTRLHVLNGNPSRRPLRREPKPRLGAPCKPSWMLSDVDASAEWDRVVPELDAIGLLTRVDGFTLEAYCTTYSLWLRNHRVVSQLTTDELGSMIEVENKSCEGTTQRQIPQVNIALKFLALANRFATELGLSPASRARMAEVPARGKGKQSDDPMEDALNG